MRRQVDNRRRALSSRLAIDEAIGLVQQRSDCTRDEAFTELWGQAGSDETRLWDVVTGLTAPPPPPLQPPRSP